MLICDVSLEESEARLGRPDPTTGVIIYGASPLEKALYGDITHICKDCRDDVNEALALTKKEQKTELPDKVKDKLTAKGKWPKKDKPKK